MIARSCQSVPRRKTRSSFNVTASDTTEGMVVCEGSVTPQSRPRLPITHGACSGVADGMLAMRLLLYKSFCMYLYHKTHCFTTGLSEVLPVVSCQHPTKAPKTAHIPGDIAIHGGRWEGSGRHRFMVLGRIHMGDPPCPDLPERRLAGSAIT